MFKEKNYLCHRQVLHLRLQDKYFSRGNLNCLYSKALYLGNLQVIFFPNPIFHFLFQFDFPITFIQLFIFKLSNFFHDA